MNRIAVVTATRAEYGLLSPLIKRINDDENLQLDLIVTGAHLSEKYGNTIELIENDGFPISHKIDILESGDSSYDISCAIANAIKKFAKCFFNDKPDILIILGDRYEMLGVAISAMNENIPIAHLHGGEVTIGAIDDSIRHAITKMSYLHFTSTEDYRKRVIQLGESPDRVFNVGALGIENILCMNLLSEADIRKTIGLAMDEKYAVGTFHPVTLDTISVSEEVKEFCEAIKECRNIKFLLTMANADKGGGCINQIISDYALENDNIIMINNLGTRNYLSAIKYARFVIGNSSSGIIEAPALGTPTVNVGDRQKGRIMAETIVNCIDKKGDIISAIHKAESMEHKSVTLYGDGNTSIKIVEIIKSFLSNKKINLKKGFYSING